MRNKLAGAVLAGTLVVGSGAVAAQPAEAQQDQTSEDRAQEREERLQQKVEDGTITEERADEIRARIAAREERRAAKQAARAERLDDLAATLNTAADALKEELRSGSSLADLAEAAGVDVAVVIDQLEAEAIARIAEKQAAREERLQERVAAGSITVEQADEVRERIAARQQARGDLRDRITDRVNGDRPDRAERRGHRRDRGHGG